MNALYNAYSSVFQEKPSVSFFVTENVFNYDDVCISSDTLDSFDDDDSTDCGPISPNDYRLGFRPALFSKSPESHPVHN